MKFSEYLTYLKVKYLKIGSVQINELSTDGTMAGNSDLAIPTEKAVKTYVDAKAGAIDAMLYKGVIDCAASPNYPAGDAGYVYIVSVAGKIGGASGTVVQAGDMLVCNTDGTTAGTEAAKGAYWDVIQTDTGTLYTAETSVTDNTLPRYDGTTGTLIQKSLVTIDDTGTINIPSGQTFNINGSAHNHDASYIAKSLGAASGDIIYYDGAAFTKLGIGTAGQVLAASSTGFPYWKTA